MMRMPIAGRYVDSPGLVVYSSLVHRGALHAALVKDCACHTFDGGSNSRVSIYFRCVQRTNKTLPAAAGELPPPRCPCSPLGGSGPRDALVGGLPLNRVSGGREISRRERGDLGGWQPPGGTPQFVWHTPASSNVHRTLWLRFISSIAQSILCGL